MYQRLHNHLLFLVHWCFWLKQILPHLNHD